jgi:hypothetical protein
MDVKCIIGDYLAEKMNKDGSVRLESISGHGDQVRITSDNGVSCVVDIDDLISAAQKCKLNSIGR